MKSAIARGIYFVILICFFFVELVRWCKEAFIVGPLQRHLGRSSPVKRDISWGQKLGLMPLKVKPMSNPRAIIHCASMGEVVAAGPLIKQLLVDKPQLYLVITTNTLTGKEQVARLKQQLNLSETSQTIQHQYLPLDLPHLMVHFLRKIDPSFVMILEVELWPNLIRQCHKRSIPTFVINGRMTDKTTKGYSNLKWLSSPMISQLSKVFVRNEKDESNYLKLGVAPERLILEGNIKLDVVLPDLSDSNNRRTSYGLSDRMVLLGGSTHLGEETLLLNLYQALKAQYPNLALILVPRHPQRFEDVFKEIANTKLQVVKHSEKQQMLAAHDVMLVDEMGVLSTMYGICDIAIVGGSFADKGGHNPVEPASYGKPVMMGPNIYNNPEVCAVLADIGALTICHSESELDTKVRAYLVNSALQLADGEAGRNTLEAHTGLIQRILRSVYQTLP